MKVSSWWIWLVAYISYLVGEISISVGEYSTSRLLVWYDPIIIFFMFAIPSWFAYEAGKEENK